MPVNFYLDKRPDKKGDVSVRVSISISGTRLVTSSGIKVTASKWDATKQQMRKGSSNAGGIAWNDINAYLSRIATTFAEYESKCIASNFTPTVADLKEFFNENFSRRGKSEKKQRNTFWSYYDQFIRERSISNQWTNATHTKFSALRHHLESWRPDISFESFSESGLISFITHLREHRNLLNSTIGKQIDFLKWYLRWAYNKGYNTNSDFLQFSPKLKSAPNQVVFLEWEELMRVFNFEIPDAGAKITIHNPDGTTYEKEIKAKRGLEVTRDIFLLCCFTSLRFSDAMNLKRSDITNDSITITTIKTSDTITIELNDYAREILMRHKNADYNGYAMPRITNQRMNQYVKDLCELCEINKPITHVYFRGSERIEEVHPKFELIGTHTGRRTFICNALSLGIPAEIVMKWTGHADYKSMKPYIDIANKAKAKAMQVFNKH